MERDFRHIVSDEMEALRERIASNIIAEGSNATGKTIQSMSVEITDDSGSVRAVLYGRRYFGALETGSRPWQDAQRFRRFVPKAFADQIAEWARAKGLTLNEYAVAKKIIFEGTELYREGGRDTIYSKEIPVTLEKLAKRITELYQVRMIESIKLN